MTALKDEQVLGLNGTDFRRRTGVDPETFIEMEAALHNRETSKRKSGRPPALPVRAQLLSTLEFWQGYRTFVHLGQAWGMHETTVLRTVIWRANALLQSGHVSIPDKKSVRDAGTVLTAVVVDVREMPCERTKKAGRPDTGAVLPKTAARVLQLEKEAPHAELAAPDPSSHHAHPVRDHRPWGDA